MVAMELLVIRHFQKAHGTVPKRNVLKGIDILSKGSVFGSIRRESQDSVHVQMGLNRNSSDLTPAGKRGAGAPAAGEEQITPRHESRRGSFSSYMAAVGSSNLMQTASELTTSRRPSVFKNSSRLDAFKDTSSSPTMTKDISVGGKVGPSRNNISDLSMLSNTSFIHLEKLDDDPSGSQLKPSRFSHMKLDYPTPTSTKKLASVSSGSQINMAPSIRKSSTEEVGKETSNNYMTLLPKSNSSASHMKSSYETGTNQSHSAVPSLKDSRSQSSITPTSDLNLHKSQNELSPRFKGMSERQILDANFSRNNSIKHPTFAGGARGSKQDSESNMSNRGFTQASYLTFQNNKNSEEIVSSAQHEDSSKKVLKNLLKAMEKLRESRANTPKRKTLPSKKKRSKSVGAQEKIYRLIESMGLEEVLKQYLRLMTNETQHINDLI